MCGRFSFSPQPKTIEERFNIKVDKGNYKPRYNCSPTQNLTVIANNKPDQLCYFHWGLIPFWSKEKKIGSKLINAKADTISIKPAFRDSFRQKRCLVLSDGFFEWKKVNSKDKIPYRILMRDHSPFSIAGIWDSWKNEMGELIHSFAIITTNSNNLINNIHHRMPVILEKKNEKDWLEKDNPALLVNLMKPISSDLMKAYPVSGLVNSPSNDFREILKPVEDRSLF